MCRVKSFLACISLEAYGLLTGWITLLKYCLMALIIVASVVYEIVLIFIAIGDSQTIKTTWIFGIITGLFMLVIIYPLINICYVLTAGVKSRDSLKVQPYRILCMATVTFGLPIVGCAFLLPYSPRYGGYTEAVIMIQIYCVTSWLVQVCDLICINSLWKQLEEDKLILPLE